MLVLGIDTITDPILYYQITFYTSAGDRSGYRLWFMLGLGIVQLQIIFYARTGDRSNYR